MTRSRAGLVRIVVFVGDYGRKPTTYQCLFLLSVVDPRTLSMQVKEPFMYIIGIVTIVVISFFCVFSFDIIREHAQNISKVGTPPGRTGDSGPQHAHAAGPRCSAMDSVVD